MKAQDYPGIYKWTSPSNKVYVGESKTLFKRRSGYEKLKPYQIRLYNSFKFYGIENHIWEVIEICEISELKKRERYWQNFYDVLGSNGLNCRLTGTDEEKGIVSEETRKKIGLAGKNNKNMLGKKHSEETKKKMSNSAMGRKMSEGAKEKLRINSKGNKHGLGYKHTEEARKAISEKGKLWKRSKELGEKISLSKYKPIIQLDLEGNVIREWEAIKIASEELKISRTGISSCCNNKHGRKSTGGFKWKFKK